MPSGVMPIPGRALPFGNKPSTSAAEPAPAPKPAPSPAKPGVSGETLPLGASLLPYVMPFAKSGAPAQPAPAPAQPAQALPAAAPAQAAPAQPAQALPAAAPAQPAPAPAFAAVARPNSAAPEMTLDAYASLCAEMTVHPQHRADILRRYGIADDAALRVLHVRWRDRFVQDPATESQWQSKYKTFRDWLAQKR